MSINKDEHGRPLLSTREFIRLANISEQTFRSLESAGLIAPFSLGSHAKFYSFEQIDWVAFLIALRENGLTLNEIAETLDEAQEIVDSSTPHNRNESYKQCRTLELLEAKAIELCEIKRRNAVRQLRIASRRFNRINDFMRVAGTKHTYMRFVPRRWGLLIPLHTEQSTTESIASYEWVPPIQETFNALKDGCVALNDFHLHSSGTSGLLLHLSSEGSILRQFALIDLAVPPNPTVSSPRAVTTLLEEYEAHRGLRLTTEESCRADDACLDPACDSLNNVEPHLLSISDLIPAGMEAIELPSGVQLGQQCTFGDVGRTLKKLLDKTDALTKVTYQKVSEGDPRLSSISYGWHAAATKEALGTARILTSNLFGSPESFYITIENAPSIGDGFDLCEILAPILLSAPLGGE